MALVYLCQNHAAQPGLARFGVLTMTPALISALLHLTGVGEAVEANTENFMKLMEAFEGHEFKNQQIAGRPTVGVPRARHGARAARTGLRTAADYAGDGTDGDALAMHGDPPGKHRPGTWGVDRGV